MIITQRHPCIEHCETIAVAVIPVSYYAFVLQWNLSVFIALDFSELLCNVYHSISLSLTPLFIVFPCINASLFLCIAAAYSNMAIKTSGNVYPNTLPITSEWWSPGQSEKKSKIRFLYQISHWASYGLSFLRLGSPKSGCLVAVFLSYNVSIFFWCKSA